MKRKLKYETNTIRAVKLASGSTIVALSALLPLAGTVSADEASPVDASPATSAVETPATVVSPVETVESPVGDNSVSEPVEAPEEPDSPADNPISSPVEKPVKEPDNPSDGTPAEPSQPADTDTEPVNGTYTSVVNEEDNASIRVTNFDVIFGEKVEDASIKPEVISTELDARDGLRLEFSNAYKRLDAYLFDENREPLDVDFNYYSSGVELTDNSYKSLPNGNYFLSYHFVDQFGRLVILNYDITKVKVKTTEPEQPKNPDKPTNGGDNYGGSDGGSSNTPSNGSNTVSGSGSDGGGSNVPSTGTGTSTGGNTGSTGGVTGGSGATTGETIGGGTTVTNPDTGGTTTTNPSGGNTNTSNGSDVEIGGVSDNTNYIDNPDIITVSSKGAKDVVATLSSANGVSNLKGRFVNGKFVLDNLPEQDGVYTVKVKVQKEDGSVSEKVVTYAVNKNGSTYDWISKVNGNFYQYLENDLVLQEHSTTRLDMSKTKFTFTLNGKVVEVDRKYVHIKEIKEADGSYTYIYTFDKAIFNQDGVWSISVSTVDTDGHASSSNASVKFQFVLDNEAPKIVLEGIKQGVEYNVTNREFTILLSDNVEVTDAYVIINGKRYEFTSDELESGTKTISLERSSVPYKVQVVAKDSAGNKTTETVSDVKVTSSVLKSLVESPNQSNTRALLGGLAGILALVGLGAWYSAVRKRRKVNLEAEQEAREMASEQLESASMSSAPKTGGNHSLDSTTATEFTKPDLTDAPAMGIGAGIPYLADEQSEETGSTDGHREELQDETQVIIDDSATLDETVGLTETQVLDESDVNQKEVIDSNDDGWEDAEDDSTQLLDEEK